MQLGSQQFVKMMQTHIIKQDFSTLQELMTIDAADVSLSCLTEKVVRQVKAERGAIFVVDNKANELYFMADTLSWGKKEIRIPLSVKSIAGSSILNNEIINIPDCYQDGRFDRSVDAKTGHVTKQLLCVPVCNAIGQVIAAIQVINTEFGRSFTDQDCTVLSVFRAYVQVAAQELVTIDAADVSLASLSDKVVRQVKAERGTIFVVDEGTNELYFLVDTTNGRKLEIRIPLSVQSIAGASILDNEVINIPDCYQDGRFDRSVDVKTGLVTTQMLCVPVRDVTGQVIAAIQVINTESGRPFTDQDCTVLRAFRAYVQVAVMKGTPKQG